MPNESLDDNESIDSLIRDYDELLSSIKLPLSYEEGKVLVSLFPEEAFLRFTMGFIEAGRKFIWENYK